MRNKTKLGALALALALTLYAVPAFAVLEVPVVSVPEGERAALYAEPHSQADILGEYYTGTSLDILGTAGDWANVSIGGWQTDNREGYMLISQMDMTNNSATVAYIRSEMPVARLLEDTKLYDRPDGAPLQDCLAGMRVGVMGETPDGWLHVRLAHDMFGYVRADAAEETGDILQNALMGLPALGYAALKEGEEAVYDQPAPGAQVVYEGGRQVELLSDEGAWRQVRPIHLEVYSGFVPEETIEATFLLRDMLLPEAQPVGAGAYVVGETLAAGLYTVASGDAEATLDIRAETFERTFALPAGADYAVYLPEHAHVTLSGGQMAPLQAEPVTPEGESQWTLSGVRRLLYGVQIVDNDECYYTITLAPDAEEGYYRITSFLEDAGYAGETAWEDTANPLYVWDDPVLVDLSGGEFIELYNCTLSAVWGNG